MENTDNSRIASESSGLPPSPPNPQPLDVAPKNTFFFGNVPKKVPPTIIIEDLSPPSTPRAPSEVDAPKIDLGARLKEKDVHESDKFDTPQDSDNEFWDGDVPRSFRGPRALDTHAPPVPPALPEQPGAVARIRKWFSSFFNVNHTVSVDSDTTNRLSGLVSQVAAMPKKAIDGLSSSLDSLLGNLPDGTATPFRRILETMLDVVALALCQDPSSFAVLSASLILRRGFLTGGMIAGLTLFVKQFLKRFEWAQAAPEEAQLQAGEETDFGKEADETAAMSFYQLVYYYTIGQLPDVTGSDVLKVLAMVNVVGNAWRHIEYFGTYILKALKAVTNFIVFKLTGTYLFDRDQNRVLDKWAVVTDLSVSLNRGGRLDFTQARAIKLQMEQIITEGYDARLPDDVLRDWRHRCDQFTRFARLSTPDQLNTVSVPPTVMTQIVGRPGIGKSLAANLLVQMLGASLGVPKDKLGSIVYRYQPELGFPNPLPTHPLICVIDDPELIKDPETAKKYQVFKANIGSGKPFSIDSPFDMKGLEIPIFSYCIIFANETDSLDSVATPEAAMRRYNGNIWRIAPTDKYQKGSMIDMDLVLKDLTKSSEAADDIWTLKSSNQVLNLTELAQGLVNLSDKIKANAHVLEASLNAVGARFMRNAGAPALEPATASDFADQKVAVNLETSVRRSADMRPRFPPAKLQGLVGKGHREVLDSAQVPPAAAKRIMTFLSFAPEDIRVESNGFRVGPRLVSVSELSKMILKEEPKPVKDLRVPLEQWTLSEFIAAESAEFYITEMNARYLNFDYMSKGQHLSDAFDDDTAIRVSRTEFCQWAACRVDNELFSHFAMIPSKSLEERYPTLFGLVKLLTAGALVGIALNVIATLFGSFYSSYRATQQAYSTHAAKKTSKGGLVRRLRPGHKAKLQADMRPEDWLSKILTHNCLTVRCYDNMGMGHTANMMGICGNFGITVKHIFNDCIPKLYVTGHKAGVYPFDIVKELPKENIRNTKMLVMFEDDSDVAHIVFPYTEQFFTDITKYHMREDQPVSDMTQMVMLRRDPYPFEFVEADGTPSETPTDRLAPQKLTYLQSFPMGDATGYASYSTKRGNGEGLAIKCAVATIDGDCGNVIICNNTRFGQGHRSIVSYHNALFEDRLVAITQPVTQEDIEDLKSSYGCIMRTSFKPLDATLQSFASKDVPFTGPVCSRPIMRLAPENAANLNTKNDIVPSLIHNCLVGYEFPHPNGSGPYTVQPTQFVPSPTRNIDAALQKFQFPTNTADPVLLANHAAAADRVYAHIKRCADPKTLEPRSEPIPLSVVLNGDRSRYIAPVDPKKSVGYGSSVTRAQMLCVQADGSLDLREPYKAQYYTKLDAALQGEFDIVRYVLNPKVELRKQGKPARMTACMPFLDFLVVKSIVGVIPGIFQSGRIYNGTIFGANLDGLDGLVFTQIMRRYERHLVTDAKNFDASENAEYSAPIEHNEAELLRIVYPWLPYHVALGFVLGARVGYLIVGQWVFLLMSCLFSGHPLTTVRNCGGVLTLYEGASMWATGESVFDDGHPASYGDDCQLGTNNPGLTQPVVAKYAKALNITFTGADKTGQLAEYTPLEELTALKTYPRVTDTHYALALLEPDVVTHIADFIHARDSNRMEATSINADAALQRWGSYGKQVFDQVKMRFDAALLAVGCRQTKVTWEDVMVNRTLAHGYNVNRRPKTRFGPHPVTLSYHFKDAVLQSSTIAPSGVSSDKDIVAKTELSSTAFAPAAPLNAITSKKQLTAHSDAVSLGEYLLPPQVRAALQNPLNPNPPSGLTKVLSREYLVATYTISHADTQFTTYTPMSFPQDLLNTSTLHKLDTFVLLRAGVRLRACVNGQVSTMGLIGFGVVPGAQGITFGDEWRLHPLLVPQLPGFFLDVATSGSQTYELSYTGQRLAHQLLDAPLVPVNGVVVPYLLSPLLSMGAEENSVIVTVYASFIDPEPTGHDIAELPAPAEVRRFKRLSKGKGKEVERGAAKLQSAQEEAGEKAQSGILDGISSAAKTATTVIGDVSTLLESLPVFDKPYSVARVPLTVPVTSSDMVNTQGEISSVMMAAPRQAYIASDNRTTCEVSTQPSWAEVLRKPSLIAAGSMSAGSLPGDVLAEWPIDPTAAFQADPNYYTPGTTAYYTRQHLFWRGSLDYILVFVSSPLQKATVRITQLFESLPGGAAVPDNAMGDVGSQTIDIVGTRVVPLKALFERATPDLLVRPTPANPPTQEDCNGRIVLQVVNPVSPSATGTDINWLLYMMAGEDFVLKEYTGLPSPWTITFSTPEDASRVPAPRFRRNRPTVHLGQATQQACLDTFASMKFPSLFPGTMKEARGINAPDVTRGPVDLLKRAHIVRSEASTGHVFPFEVPPAYFNPDFTTLIAPWMGAAGSMNYWLYVNQTAAAGSLILAYRDNGQPFNESSAGGHTILALQTNGGFQVSNPWKDLNLWYRTVPNGTVTFYDLPLMVNPLGPAQPNGRLFAYAGAGDDFSLYHLTCCPFLRYVVSPAKKARSGTPTGVSSSSQ